MFPKVVKSREDATQQAVHLQYQYICQNVISFRNLKQPHVLISLLGAGYADYTMSGHDQKIHEMIIEFYGKIKQN